MKRRKKASIVSGLKWKAYVQTTLPAFEVWQYIGWRLWHKPFGGVYGHLINSIEYHVSKMEEAE